MCNIRRNKIYILYYLKQKEKEKKRKNKPKFLLPWVSLTNVPSHVWCWGRGESRSQEGGMEGGERKRLVLK